MTVFYFRFHHIPTNNARPFYTGPNKAIGKQFISFGTSINEIGTLQFCYKVRG